MWAEVRTDVAIRSLHMYTSEPTVPQISPTMGTPLKYPALYCPFDSALSPFGEESQAHTVEWMSCYELLADYESFARMAGSGCGRLAARAYADATLDDLTIVSDWNAWLMVIDDKCDEEGIGRDPQKLRHLHETCIRVLRGAPPSRLDIPLTRALRDLRDRLYSRMPDSWMARFTRDVADYFEANQWEANNRARGTWPSPETYIRMRPYTGALYTVFDLIEMTERAVVPIEVREHPTMRQLMALASDVVCWHNDIASIQKERQHGDMHNLGLILQRKEQLSLQDALAKVGRMADSHVRRFIELEKGLDSFDTPEADSMAQRVVLGLRRWMRANFDWSHESGRFSAVSDSSDTIVALMA